MKDMAGTLRTLLEGGKHHIAADCYSALTAKIVEQAGFKAAYLGGHACSAFHYAYPDYGMFSQIEQIEQAARIAAAIDIPLIVDADTLGETVADAHHFTRRYIQAGVAGFHVEDEINPKHASLANGLIPIVEMQARLEACAKARKNSDLVIIARCDELYPLEYRGGGTGSLDQAIARGRAYKEAGADALVFPLASAEQNATLKAEIDLPIMQMGPPDPNLSMSLFTGWGWMGAAQLHAKRCKEIMETGTLADMDLVIENKEALLEMTLYDEIIADWANKTGRKTRP